MPIMKNNRNYKKNKRDLFFGYVFAFFIYACVGVVGALSIANKTTNQPNTVFNFMQSSGAAAYIQLFIIFYFYQKIYKRKY